MLKLTRWVVRKDYLKLNDFRINSVNEKTQKVLTISGTHFSTSLSPQSRNHFKVIKNEIDKDSIDFKTNYSINNAVHQKYNEALKVALSGGSDKAKARHLKQKKLLVDQRLDLLFDSYDEMLELSPVAGLHMEYGDVPRAGTVTGN